MMPVSNHLPAMSVPNWVTIVTGALPEATGAVVPAHSLAS